jgi:hypothetical protein
MSQSFRLSHVPVSFFFSISSLSREPSMTTADKKTKQDATAAATTSSSSSNSNSNSIDSKKAIFRFDADLEYPHNNGGYVLVVNNGLVGIDTDSAYEFDGFEAGFAIDFNFILDKELKRRLNVNAWYSAEAGPGPNQITLRRPNISYSLAKDIERFEEDTKAMSEEAKRATDNHFLALKTAHAAIYNKDKGPCPCLLKTTILSFPPNYKISGKELVPNEKKSQQLLPTFFTDAEWSVVDPMDPSIKVDNAETWQWWSMVRLDTSARMREVPDEEEDEEAALFMKAARGRS